MLQPFGPSLFIVDGPTVSFFGFPYPTRMALARLANGTVWGCSPPTARAFRTAPRRSSSKRWTGFSAG